MIDEQLRLERLLDATHQTVAHRRTGKADFLHTGYSLAGKGRVFDEHVVERRHQVQVADLFPLDGLQRGFHVELRHTDEMPVDQRHGQQRTHAHGVVKRHDTQRALALAVEVLRYVGNRRGAFGTVPTGHALGLAGGSGGVQQQ
ncbi:hypothetical protein D3C85_1217150 [compost metagenome]